ncbi:MAG: radical SAM protein [Bacteroidetes bacterium]|nr:radical SAM protein [Bacteroidota bacterium]
MKKKVYLIQPSFRKSDGQVVKGEYLGNRSIEMPILCATIPQYWGKEHCYEYLEDIDFDSDAGVVLITGASNDILHGYQIAEKLKARNKTIIFGGYQDVFSLQLMKPMVDAVYHGIPGPEEMEMILEDAANNNLKREYNVGVNIDFPFDYSIFEDKKLKYVQVVTSLGCHFKCDFCCQPEIYGGKFYLRSIDAVIKDLKSVRKLSRFIGFRDANFLNKKSHLVDLCTRIIAERLNIRWAAQCSVTIGQDPKLLAMMKKAGCRLLFFGLESLNQDNLNEIHKSFTASSYASLIANVHKAGIYTAAYFMFGFDHDTKNTFGEVYSFVRKTRLAIPLMNIYNPIPGTRLFQRLKNENRIDFPTPVDYVKDIPVHSLPCSKSFFKPKNMSGEELEKGFHELSKKLTTYRAIFRRSLKPNINTIILLGLNFDLRKEYKKRNVNQ